MNRNSWLNGTTFGFPPLFPWESEIEVGFYKMRDTVKVPEFATEQSACFDLAANFVPNVNDPKTFDLDYFSFYNIAGRSRHILDKGARIFSGERYKIPTGLIFNVPDGFHIEIVSRSGTALKKGLVVVNAPGIVDSDYVQEVFVLIHNISGKTVSIEQGERIAQARLVRNETTSFSKLDEPPVQKTSRTGGFGSTGNK